MLFNFDRSTLHHYLKFNFLIGKTNAILYWFDIVLILLTQIDIIDYKIQKSGEQKNRNTQ
ncbi:hypothetical protein CRH01_19960 [Chryseobacterium rhizosphaerae]|nr:hypothetical protein CRH01_19960 [Chryseobacterium rhizosphaerae]